jgi:hypothetical protein
MPVQQVVYAEPPKLKRLAAYNLHARYVYAAKLGAQCRGLVGDAAVTVFASLVNWYFL